MPVDLIVIEPLVWVDFKQASEHVASFLRNIILEGVDATQDEAVKLVHACCLERHCTVEHRVEDDSSTPEVHTESVSLLVSKDLRCYVSGSSALLPHLDAGRSLLTDTEIRYLDLPLTIKQNVVELNVTMRYILGMNVLKPINNLFEYLLGQRLLQSSAFPNVIEEIAAGAQLHNNDDMLLGLDCLVYLHDVVMPELEKKVDLLH